jgi:hypothetical protein
MTSCLNCYGVGWRDGQPCEECGGSGEVAAPDESILREGEAHSRHRNLDPDTSVSAAQGVDVKGDTLLWINALASFGPGKELPADEVAHFAYYGEISLDRIREYNRVDSISRRSSTLFGKNGRGEQIFEPWIERTEKIDGRYMVKITDEGWRQLRLMEERDSDS